MQGSQTLLIGMRVMKFPYLHRQGPVCFHFFCATNPSNSSSLLRHTYTFIYIYIERERDRDKKAITPFAICGLDIPKKYQKNRLIPSEFTSILQTMYMTQASQILGYFGQWLQLSMAIGSTRFCSEKLSSSENHVRSSLAIEQEHKPIWGFP